MAGAAKGRLVGVERHCFGAVCSFLSLHELVRLQTVCGPLRGKALDVESWRSRLDDRDQVL